MPTACLAHGFGRNKTDERMNNDCLRCTNCMAFRTSAEGNYSRGISSRYCFVSAAFPRSAFGLKSSETSRRSDQQRTLPCNQIPVHALFGLGSRAGLSSVHTIPAVPPIPTIDDPTEIGDAKGPRPTVSVRRTKTSRRASSCRAAFDQSGQAVSIPVRCSQLEKRSVRSRFFYSPSEGWTRNQPASVGAQHRK